MNWRMKIVLVNATLLAVVAMSAAPSASRGNRVVVANDWKELKESGHSKAGVTGSVNDIIEYQGDIYIGGDFKYAGGTDNDVVNSIVRWDDSATAWEPLQPAGENAGVRIGNGGPGKVFDLETWTNGGTTYLVIVGLFDQAGDDDEEDIVLWDGTDFVGVDSDLLGGGTTGIAAAEVFGDDDDLYVIPRLGGFLHNSDRFALAFWDGSIWDFVAEGAFTPQNVNRTFPSFRVIRKDGNLLYIGGDFKDWTREGGDTVLLSAIAVYALLGGISPLDGPNSGVYLDDIMGSIVHTIEVCGTDVFIGGSFDEAGPASPRIDAENIVRFDATALPKWMELDGGVNDTVFGLLVRDCSTPTATLFVGGKFSDVDGDDGVDTDHLAIASYSILSKTWHSDTFDGGLSVTAGGAGTVEGILSFTVDGDIYAVGSFLKSPGLPFEFISPSDPLHNVGHWDPQ